MRPRIVSTSRDVLRLPRVGRSGWVTAGVVAAMVFAALLVAAAGLGIAGIIRLANERQNTRLTVQVADGDAARIFAMLAAAPEVSRATPVDRADLVRLLRPWLGDDGAADLPIPAMIDVDVPDPAAMAAVERQLHATGGVIRIDRSGDWLAPIGDVAQRWVRLAAALVAIFGLATAAIVVLAVRGALATHRETIALMHMLGATDRQIGWLFQRRIGIQTLIGGMIGTATAAVTTATAAVTSATVVERAVLRPLDWAMLAAIPPVVMAAAMLATRLAVGRAPGRMP